jgi:restriction endonuclease S subunit
MPDRWPLAPVREFIRAEFPGEWGSDPGSPGTTGVVFRSTDIDDEGHLCEDWGGVERVISGRKAQVKRLIPGDVLLETSGGSPDRPVGRVAAYKGSRNIPCLGSNFIRTLRPAQGISSRYLLWTLYALQRSSAILRYQQQTTGIINLKLKDYLEHRISKPPYPIQLRIAEILDWADTHIASTEATVWKYQQLKVGLMRDLFTRGLNTQGELRRSRDEAPSLYKPSQYGWIPHDWSPSDLGTSCEWASGGTPSRQRPEWWTGDFPWLTPKDMKTFHLSDTSEHVTEKAALLGSRIAPAESVFIVVRGMILAHTFPVVFGSRPFAFNQDIKALRGRHGLNNRFLAHWLCANQDAFLRKTTDMSAGAKIGHRTSRERRFAAE